MRLEARKYVRIESIDFSCNKILRYLAGSQIVQISCSSSPEVSLLPWSCCFTVVEDLAHGL